MKKNLEKIFASASFVVAVILIMVLLVTAFGGIETSEFNSQLVQGLLITLAIIYVVLAIITLILAFISTEAIKEITLRSEQEGSVRVTVQVVTKFVKKACAEVEGVKCQRVSVVTDDYGVRLKVSVKVVDKDVLETETYLRALLEDLFRGEFGFKFHSIEFKVTSLAPKYKADQAAIEETVAKRLEEMKAKEEAAKEAAEAAEAEAAEEATEEVAEETLVEDAPAEDTAVEEIAEEAPVEATPAVDVAADEFVEDADIEAESAIEVDAPVEDVPAIDSFDEIK